MSRHTRLVLVAAILVSASVPAPAQVAGTSFRAGVDLVVLDVCVQSSTGISVAGLTRDDFVVLDNGVQQDIRFFDAGPQIPVAVVLLIDRSSSMRGEPLDQAKRAALAFAATLSPADQIEIIGFNDTAERVVPFTSDADAVRNGVSAMQAGGQTGLNEAVLVGLHELAAFSARQAEPVRQVLVVLSDGDDTTARLTFDDVLPAVRSSGAIVYGVSIRLDSKSRPLSPRQEFAALASTTGGRMIPSTLAGLVSAYQTIGTELRQLYRIGFEPEGHQRRSSWHVLQVRLDRADLAARTRPGYVSDSQSSTRTR